MCKNILIIDPDLEASKALKYGLVDAGYHAYYCLTGREGLAHLLKGHYHLVILESVQSDLLGREILSVVRKTIKIPTIVISNADSIQEKVDVLLDGADDYIVKPFALEEVTARVAVLCRRYDDLINQIPPSSVTMCGSFMIDLNYKIVFYEGKRLDLTRTEYNLLQYLIENKNQVVSKEQIYQYVWKEEPFNSDNSVMCQIYNLRKKIEDDPARPKYIQTVWGFGYRFVL